MHLMTERQLYALTHACANPEVPTDSYTRVDVSDGKLAVVTIVTVDVYDGPPMWHASISAQTASGLVPMTSYRWKARAYARQRLRELLRGVGEGDTFHDRSEYVLHARRAVSQAELELLRSVAA